MTTNFPLENPCTCAADATTLCPSCLLRVRNLPEMLEAVGNLRSDVDDIDVDDFVTEDRVERMIENALDEADRDRSYVTESDMEDAISRAVDDAKEELEGAMARDSEVEALSEELDALRGLVIALQARTFEARWKRFVARLRAALHVEQLKHVLRTR